MKFDVCVAQLLDSLEDWLDLMFVLVLMSLNVPQGALSPCLYLHKRECSYTQQCPYCEREPLSFHRSTVHGETESETFFGAAFERDDISFLVWCEGLGVMDTGSIQSEQKCMFPWPWLKSVKCQGKTRNGGWNSTKPVSFGYKINVSESKNFLLEYVCILYTI